MEEIRVRGKERRNEFAKTLLCALVFLMLFLFFNLVGVSMQPTT